MQGLWHPSPNFGPRRAGPRLGEPCGGGMTPSLIVLHFTAMDTADAALARLCDPKTEVSAHYLIAGDGRLWQMVDEVDRAWHAGRGEWHGQDDINSRSIGIELDNRGNHPFSALQMTALEGLLAAIMTRWQIAPDGVIGHSDMAPGRKCDPGARFDWRRLACQGLASWPQTNAGATPDVARFRTMARTKGFSADVSDELLLEAVRLRFRPWGQGGLCAADMAIVG